MSMMHARWGRLYRGTTAELALEDAVASLGVPYRVQFPGFLYGVRFFPDFLLPTLGVVIEVDDPSHNTEAKRIADEDRTMTLGSRWGVTVVRCTNAEATENPHGAVATMLRSAGLWPIPDKARHLKIADELPSVGKCPPKSRKNWRAERRKKRTKLKGKPNNAR